MILYCYKVDNNRQTGLGLVVGCSKVDWLMVKCY